MSVQWVVLLQTGSSGDVVTYGPIDDANEASEFAEFLTAEVDPATVRMLKSPSRELLGFWRHRMMEAAEKTDAEVRGA